MLKPQQEIIVKDKVDSRFLIRDLLGPLGNGIHQANF